MRIALWSNQKQLRDETHPMHAVRVALEGIGDVEVAALREDPKPGYDVLVTWNGLHAGRDRLVPDLRDAGVPVVVVERGFFDRMAWSQIDHCGFNHTASWARGFMTHADCERLHGITGHTISAMRPRSDGHVLLLAQKAYDTQLREAPYQSPDPFVRAVEIALPEGIDLRVRAHPVERYECGPGRRAEMIGGTLQDAIAGARFVVTINSNGANDAIFQGCPALCIGPSVAGQCTAALSSSPGTLQVDLLAMLSGWSPGSEYAADYCSWLADHQYSLKELAEGTPVRDAIDRAVAR